MLFQGADIFLFSNMSIFKFLAIPLSVTFLRNKGLFLETVLGQKRDSFHFYKSIPCIFWHFLLILGNGQFFERYSCGCFDVKSILSVRPYSAGNFQQSAGVWRGGKQIKVQRKRRAAKGVC